MNRRLIIAFAFMFIFTICTSAYGVVLAKMEPTLYWFVVPAGNITEPKTIRGPGPPITVSPIKVDIDQFHPLKKIFNPSVVQIGTHWIYNYGKTPVRIRMELVNVPPDIQVKWDLSANFPYDETTHTFTKPLMPGQRIDGLVFHWEFHIPLYYMDEPVIYRGGVKLIDADTNNVLTFIPIEIVRGSVSQSYGGVSCCG